MKKTVYVIIAAVLFGLLSSSLAFSYPQFDIKGYKKWEFYKINVDPQANFFLGQTYLGYGYPNIGLTGPWQERLQLQITANMSEKLSVKYDIDQQPETPQKSDVKVKYDNSELTFGDFQANFGGNEFTSVSKYVNGVMLTSKDKNYDVTIVPSSKLRSDTQQLTSQYGNNTMGPYNLGHAGIIEGSERIEINQVLQRRGTDYTLNYFEGKITFKKILTANDEIKYAYEYTNVIELYFPTVSKRDFIGYRGSVNVDSNMLFSGGLPKDIPVTYNATDEFPSSSSSLAGEMIWESGGLYILDHTPLVVFSEQITMGGVLLKKSVDYAINYTDGSIQLYTESLPGTQEPLTINYQYYGVTSEAENISGQGSRGLYKITNRMVVDKSEIIAIDGIKQVRSLDYSIDYENGRLLFQKSIGIASNIFIKYKRVSRFTPTEDQKPQPKFAMTLGGTYLKESAKKASTATSTTITDLKKGSNIAANQVLYLNYYPVDSTQPIAVLINGVATTEGIGFYVPTTEAPNLNLRYINDKDDPSDGYAAGAIKILPTLQSTDEIRVSYSYSTSVIDKFNGTGNGSRGPYYMTTKNAAIVGSERIQTWDQGSSYIKILTRNSTKELADGDYSINYNYPFVPYIIFNNPMPLNKNYQVTFSYIPATQNVNADINRDLIAFDATIKVGDTKINTAYATSHNDQVYSTEFARDQFTGNNSRGSYALTHQNLLEISEKVYIDGWLVNKDIDYFINYTTGQVTFYFLTLTPNNTIAVEYQYKTVGAGVVQAVEGKAVKLSAETKAFGVNMTGEYRSVDPNFSPMGTTAVGAGTRRQDLGFSYNPSKYFSASKRVIEAYQQIGNFVGYNNWSSDQVTTAMLYPATKCRIDFSHRYYRTMDDILPGNTVHSNDTIMNTYSTGITPNVISNGFLSFINGESASRTVSMNNTTLTRSSAQYFSTTNKFGVGPRINFGIDYIYSEPITATSEAETSHSISKDNNYSFDWDMSFKPIQRLFSRAKLITHDQKDLLSRATVLTKNEAYNIDFIPISTISANYDRNRTENLSVQIGGNNPRTERSSLSTRFVPNNNLSVAWNGSDNNALQETGSRSNGKSSTTSVSISTPFRLGFTGRFDASLSEFTVVTGSIETPTDTNSITQDYGVTFNPFSFFSCSWNYVTQGYTNLSSTVKTNTQNVANRYSAHLYPASLIKIDGNLNTNVTNDLNTGLSKPKYVMDATATYKLYDWGNISYGWNQERNHGDILGGVVTNLDLLKLTNNISFNMIINLENPIVDNLTIKADWKQVMYYDFLVPSNNFKGNIIAFEGALNF